MKNPLPFKYPKNTIVLYFIGIMGAGGFFVLPGITPEPTFVSIPVHEMKITFIEDPKKSIRDEADGIFSTIVNGSYFWQTGTGMFFPAGLWKEDKKILSPMDMTDMNLSQVVTYSRQRNIITIQDNLDYRDNSCTIDCIAFQAGPLIASGWILTSHYNGSWHAEEKHERTILGIRNNTPMVFIFTDKVSLSEAGKKILGKYPSISSLINLDGWPSTAFKTTNLSFHGEQKLPILLHIR